MTRNDIYLSDGKKITVGGAFDAGARIGVAAKNAKAVITSGYATHNTAQPSVYFFENGEQVTFNGVLYKDIQEETWEPVQRTYFKGYSLSIGGDIGVILYLDLTEQELAEGASVDFSWKVNDQVKTHTVALREQDLTADGCRAACPVAVAEMNSEITAELLIGGEIRQAETYSVAAYADVILTDESFAERYVRTENENGHDGASLLSELRLLVKSMLDYGGKAQSQFDRDTAHPANENLTAEDEESP